jgi:RNA polymerase sigma factor (TIGR02999 family)
MRNVIVDEAREWCAQKRGAGAEHLTLSAADDEGVSVQEAERLVQVHDALLNLEKLEPTLAQTVDMRYFGGYSESEIAELLDISERTVRRRWETARSWLAVSLQADL